MNRITISVPESLDDRLDELAGDDGPYDSKSEAVRGLIHDLEDEVQQYEAKLRESHEQLRECEESVTELRTELERAEQRVDQLQQANLLILNDREQTQELEVYVSEEKRRKEAGRLKSWWNDWTGWD